MSQQTIYLQSWRALRQADGGAGLGRAFAAMALPRAFESMEGVVEACAPSPEALRDVQAGRLSVRDYMLAFGARLAHRQGGPIEPGELSFWVRGRHGQISRGLVQDRDALCCSCAPRRKANSMELLMGAQIDLGRMPCHLEVLAPHLVEAGWRVILYGDELTRSDRGWTWRGAPYSWDPLALQ